MLSASVKPRVAGQSSKKERNEVSKVTIKEMIDLIDADIEFALEFGDKEFAGYLYEAKANILERERPAGTLDYAKSFGREDMEGFEVMVRHALNMRNRGGSSSIFGQIS